jgi:glutamyl-tRNA synthetase
MKLEKEMQAYALKNAIEYGSAVVGKVLPKLFNHGLDKKDIGKIMPELNKVINEVNKMSPAQKEKEFEKVKKFIPEKEEKEKTLPEIDVSGLKEVVTRLAPEPSKYNHLGHAMSFLLNYQYAKRYGGKCVLRFEDTNPEKVTQEYVDAMKEDVLDYLDIKVDGIRFVSDDMKLLYDYAEKMIKMDKAYMCFCDREKMQDLRHKGKECECRERSKEDNLKEWKNFVEGKYLKGEAVLRIKGDMKSQNHVMRDSVLFRAIPAKHYKYGDKYKVWPMYDFYNPIEDSLMGVTLILRSNEFDLRVELQDYIKDLLGLKKQKIIQYGRFNVIDFTTKGREIRELVESGELIGWDDPRLITLRALKRRGITKEAIYELVEQVGLSKHPVNLNFDMIAAINRKTIDGKVNRYFFVQSPNKVRIKGARELEIEIPLHPAFPDRGFRKLKTNDEFYVSDELKKGKYYRFMHLFNVKDNEFISEKVDEKLKAAMIHWLPVCKELVKVKVLMDNGEWIDGFGEPDLKNVKKGEGVQFERFGFVRLDEKTKNEMKFWFSHK